MPQSLLIKNGTILTLGTSGRVLPKHSVYIEDGIIRKIGPSAEIKEIARKEIDASGKIVLPGYINTHMHCYSTFARGLTKTAPASSFLFVLKNLWWRLDKALTTDDCYYSALIVLLEAVRHGTTTFIDHHASPSAIRGSLAAIGKAFTQTGLRGCLCYEVSDRDGIEAAKQGLEENAAFIRDCKDRNDHYLRALFGLHASFTLTDVTLKAASAMGHDLSAGFHIHAAEAESDQEYTTQHYGKRVVERLNEFGILGPGTITAHCVHINEKEMDLLAETDTVVVHNPQSNMNNAVGIADITAMRKKGILVGLGTDAMTVNMTEELRSALWCQHHLHKNPSIGFSETASTLLLNNSVIAGRMFNLPLGELKEGSAADLILQDYNPATPLTEGNWIGQLIFGISQSPVDTTIVAGTVLMQDKKLLLDLDENEIYAKARKQAEGLWKRM